MRHKQSLVWHTIMEKMPGTNQHILVELDDYTIISGNMTRKADDIYWFAPDYQLKDKNMQLIWIDSILRWCAYPEDNA